MSDMSSLSHEFASTTDFSHHVNQAVLLLKKNFHGSKQAELNAQSLAKAFSLIEGIVVRLLQRLDRQSESVSADSGIIPEIPEDILSRLEEKEQGNLSYFIDDLMSLQKALTYKDGLTANQIRMLESICEVADASASATFRKLWRR